MKELPSRFTRCSNWTKEELMKLISSLDQVTKDACIELAKDKALGTALYYALQEPGTKVVMQILTLCASPFLLLFFLLLYIWILKLSCSTFCCVYCRCMFVSITYTAARKESQAQERDFVWWHNTDQDFRGCEHYLTFFLWNGNCRRHNTSKH